MSEQNFSGSGDESQAYSTLELMKNARRWLVWRYVGDGGENKKMPYYADGTVRQGTLDSRNDVDKLVTYEEALDVSEAYSGLGFALGYDDDLKAYWQGIDLDKVKDNGLEDLAHALPGYVELSPSGRGVHAIGLGEPFSNVEKERGVEAYCSGRYFTFTGDEIRDSEPVDLLNWENTLGHMRLVRFSVIDGGRGSDEKFTVDRDTVEDLWEALQAIPNQERDEWKQVGMALASLAPVDGIDAGWRMFRDWSMSQGYPEWHVAKKGVVLTESTLEKDFRSFRPNSISYKSVFAIARQHGFVNDLSWRKKSVRTESRLIRVPRLSDYRSIKPIEFLLDGQIPVGSLTIAGVRGGGKTTMLVSLASIMTGSCVGLHPMMPKVKRKVIWVTEDEDQIHRIIVAMINTGEIADPELFWDRFIMIRAKRSEPMELARALGELGEAEGLLVNVFERGEHVAQPLIILDTVAATLEIKEENSNSDVSRAVAAVRQSIPKASVWFVTHVAKGMGRTDTLREMTARGASAFESDVQGNAVLAIEDDLPDKRFLILGKKRVDVDRNEITATRLRWETETSAVWGDRKERVSYVTVEATDQEERTEAVEEARETAQERQLEAAERRIQEACQGAANDARREGFEGLVLRGGRGGGEGSIEGYERLKRVTWDWLRKDLCGVRGNKTDVKAGFKRTVCGLFEYNGDVEDEHCIVAVRAQEFGVAGVAE